VNITNGAGHTFTGPAISGGAGASYDAIRASGSSDLAVNGGNLASARYAVYSTATDYVVINGVNMRGAANVSRYSVDATTEAIANNII
jgi:hypothetical protein